MSTGTATFNFAGAKVLVTSGTSGISLRHGNSIADAGAAAANTGTRNSAADCEDEVLAVSVIASCA
ncbi:MAG: hypothetical protein IPK95_11745 [Cellvibrionales bacterium]|nr:hypothetical protein [Cellvibrionales bacterium]